MGRRPLHVAVACCRVGGGAPAESLYPDPDGPLLEAALADLGAATTFVSWDDPSQEWAHFDIVVVRSTWDSVDRPDEYLAWVDAVSRATQLTNPAGTIGWNLDKHYLRELDAAGIAVPVTSFVPPGEAWEPPSDRFVVKPAVSAGGRETALYDLHDRSAAVVHVDRLHRGGHTAIVQAYLPAIDSLGETKQTFIDSVFSHAINTGPFLELGRGVIDRPWEISTGPRAAIPTPAERALADDTVAFLRAIGLDMLYARVDSTVDGAGRPVLLEVELIDPVLSLWADPEAPRRLAEAIVSSATGRVRPLRDARGMHPNVARVTSVATGLGLAVEARTFPEGTRTADDAARAVGCDVGQIVKSLVFLLDGAPVMALVAGSNRLDEGRLADALGGTTVTRADADAVRAATGFPIGGVPPFGHTTPLPTAVDEDLLAYDEVWAAAGTPHDVFAVAPGDLVRVTGGTVAGLRSNK